MTVEYLDANSLPSDLNPAYPEASTPGMFREYPQHMRGIKLVTQKFYSVATSYFNTGFDRMQAVLEAVTGNDYPKLGGHLPAYFLNPSNWSTTVPDAKLAGTYGISISGNAATADSAASATSCGKMLSATSATDCLNIQGVQFDLIQMKTAKRDVIPLNVQNISASVPNTVLTTLTLKTTKGKRAVYVHAKIKLTGSVSVGATYYASLLFGFRALSSSGAPIITGPAMMRNLNPNTTVTLNDTLWVGAAFLIDDRYDQVEFRVQPANCSGTFSVQGLDTLRVDV